MQKYEYKCVSIWGKRDKITWIMNEYGQEGWELVHVEGVWHYFKRPLGE